MKRTLIVAAAVLALAGCGTSAKPAAPKTITAAGTLTLMRGAYLNEDNVNCTGLGDGGYGDIQSGVQVVVYDASGKSLALGQLSAGSMIGGDECTFTFSVSGVPAGMGPYSVEVSHRGKIAFTEATAGVLRLTLGS